MVGTVEKVRDHELKCVINALSYTRDAPPLRPLYLHARHTLRLFSLSAIIRSHYDTLGLRRDANFEQIKKAYKQAALRHHPDRGGSDAALRRSTRRSRC